jgi:hypothetical protein
VGQFAGPKGEETAFLWTAANGMRLLNGGPKGPNIGVTAISASDEIVGWDGAQTAFVWQKPNRLYQLFNLLPPNSAAYGINNAGQIAAVDASLGAVLLTPTEP